MTEERRLPTPHGEARVVVRRAKRPVAALVLSHGAGRGIDTADLTAIAQHLPTHEITTYLVEQPWVLAGRRIAPRGEVLDECLVAVCDQLRMRSPLILGGRSAGARSSLRQARRLGAVGALALAFPLHPPGKPERSRAEELRNARVPTLVVQGEVDPMGRPEEFPAGTDVRVIPGVNHGFARGSARIPEESVARLLAWESRDWILTLVGRPVPRRRVLSSRGSATGD